ncbi:MAG: nitroreductase family protein [Oscillospiraceae bacterium]|nr:nitroreductase family protein [Oscillospiraceae bacterium]
MDVSEVIKKRKSIRRYEQGATVTDEQVKLILEAAMLAPSAKNKRPWEFMVVRNKEKLAEVMDVHPYSKMLETAGLGIIVSANMDFDYKGFFPQDCAAATQNILLQCAEMNLGTCWCGVYPVEELVAQFKNIFELPENIVPFAIIAVGTSSEEFGSRGFYEEEKVQWIN